MMAMQGFRRWLSAGLMAGVLCAPLLLAACSSGGTKMPPAGSAEPDKFLFDHGNQALAKKHWMEAREYYRALVERYPQSAYRPDAKLALGDTYIQENTAESRVLATNEFNEFLNFFPTSPRADYAQFRIGYAHYKQMLGPQRDQTETREAILQFGIFFKRYPNSTLTDEVKKYDREARDRLSESEFEVGRYYARINWCAGAVARLEGVVKEDPTFTNRDGVYFYLGECYYKSNQHPAALPWYDRIVKEFQRSDYLDRAKKRIAELKISTPPK
jgi:outer membrane protein assembly factor BamD